MSLTLLRPEWLLALLPLALAARLFWSRRSGIGAWEAIADPALLGAMTALGHVERAQSRRPFFAAFAAMALAVVALAGPAMERRDAPSFRNLDGVLFVVDASASVTEDARWPQMLTMGRFGLSALGSRPGGLIVYAGDAYSAIDMTHDHLQLGQTLSLIAPDTVPDKGSRPERGLELAASLLRQAEVIAGDVVLFTDGAGLGSNSRNAALEIARLGARLSVVTPVAGAAAIGHAEAGAGRVFTLEETEALGDWLSDDARRRLERRSFPLLIWADFGRYVLILALLPLLLLFRRAAR